MNKRVLILASGGLDSTYLINENLKKGNYVNAVYTKVKNNEVKVLSELRALSLQKNYFNKTFNKENQLYTLNEDAVEIKINEPSSNLHLYQMPLWILTVLFNNQNIDEVQIGYVMNDDAVSFLDDLVNIYKSYKPLCKSGKLPKLKFPAAKLKKREMLSRLPQELIETIVFCESPYFSETEGKFEPCNKPSSYGCCSCGRYNYEGLFSEIVNMNHKIYINPENKNEKLKVNEQLKFDFSNSVQPEPSITEIECHKTLEE